MRCVATRWAPDSPQSGAALLSALRSARLLAASQCIGQMYTMLRTRSVMAHTSIAGLVGWGFTVIDMWSGVLSRVSYYTSQ
jgi:hypothetical protein